MNTIIENDSSTMRKDPRPQSLQTIAHVMPIEEEEQPWRALYFENDGLIYRPLVAWCGVLNGKGKYIGGDKDSHDLFGLVVVGNRLEIPDTHETFVAYVRNAEERVVRDLISDWRMANNH